MNKIIKKAILLATVVLLVAASLFPLTGFAKEWWQFETVYTVNGQKPAATTGPASRIFLPSMEAKTIDGIDMEMDYQVTKDDEVLASGLYTEGVYFDLTGPGTYLFTLTGHEAANSYSFQVEAQQTLPSIVAQGPIPAKVYLEEAFTTPEATLILDGQEAPAEIRLEMADGTRYQYSSGKAVPKPGLMTVYYSAQLNGEAVELAYTVQVIDPDLGFYDDSGAFYPAGTKVQGTLDLYGAVLDNQVNKSYTFSQLLDVSKMTKDVPLIVLNNASLVDRTVPRVRIVDAHDSRNYIEITGRWSADNSTVVYTVAAASGQDPVGHMGGVEYYNLGVFGTETTFPTSPYTDKTHGARFYYDAQEKAVYAGWYDNVYLVSDFDADYQVNPWEGFTTGEVYIVVERHYENDYICVESVAGQSLAAVAPDSVAPVLIVDTGDMASVPHAVAGQSYPVFAAEAVDAVDSSVPVELHIYKGCNASDGVELAVKDNAFVPYEEGYYTLVYSAEDRYGNTAREIINILAMAPEEAPAISALIEGLPETAFVGERVELPEVQNLTGGSGSVTCQIQAVYENGTVEPVTERYAVFSQAGQNALEYILTDYLGMTQTYRFAIACTTSEDPILYRLEMPQLLFSGKTIQLPAAEYAEDASVSVAITATLDGQPLEITDNAVTAVTDQPQADLVLTYTAKSATGEASMEYHVQVLGGDTSDRTTFFRPVDGTVTVEQKADAIGLTMADANAGVQFINSIFADKLSLQMKVSGEQNASDRIVITLSDAMQPEISVRLDIVKKPEGDTSGKSEFYINGVQAGDIVGDFYGGVAALGITYQRRAASFVDTEGNTLGTIITTENGERFQGFPSGLVNLVISAGAVGEGGLGLDILQINNQAFTDDSTFFDNFPEVAVDGDVTLQADVGAQVVLPAAKAADVFSPNTTVSLTVYNGDHVILENQPVTEPYVLTLDAYGAYRAVYHYTDGTVERSVTYIIQTLEHEPPQLVLPKLPAKAKVGEVVQVALPEVSDGHTENIHLSIFLQAPDGTMIKLNEELLQFTPEQAGVYTLIYYATDDCNNYQIAKHEITVQ